MDVQMPGMDGWRPRPPFARRRLGPARSPPIVALTAHTMAGDRERCLGSRHECVRVQAAQAREPAGGHRRAGAAERSRGRSRAAAGRGRRASGAGAGTVCRANRRRASRRDAAARGLRGRPHAARRDDWPVPRRPAGAALGDDRGRGRTGPESRSRGPPTRSRAPWACSRPARRTRPRDSSRTRRGPGCLPRRTSVLRRSSWRSQPLTEGLLVLRRDLARAVTFALSPSRAVIAHARVVTAGSARRPTPQRRRSGRRQSRRCAPRRRAARRWCRDDGRRRSRAPRAGP